MICDTAKQTIPLSVLARNQTKGLDSRSPTRPEVREERHFREKPGRLARGHTEGELVKEPREGSWQRETQRGSREWTAEETSQDELAVLSRQRSAEGSSEGRPVKTSWDS